MAKRSQCSTIPSGCEDILADITDFGDAVQAEIRNHTGGRRKNAYVYIEVAAAEWRNLAMASRNQRVLIVAQ